ncbi:hypothetical protein GVN18_11305 [Pseudomonas sp. ODNR1LW]|nr:hypothetical protein [Pseudomonas sp. ODNR1LW]
MDRKVLLSLLSMDIYNRGDQNAEIPGAAGIFELNNIGIGNLIYRGDHEDIIGVDFENSASFHAEVWRLGGEIFIVYEGTDNPAGDFDNLTLNGILTGDLLNGWTIGGGYAPASQAQYAIDVYEAVAKRDAGASSNYTIFDGALSGITLTGHSLGGGLAGFVAALSGNQAVLFDHMPFGLAAIAQYVSEVVTRIAASAAALDALNLDLAPGSSTAVINAVTEALMDPVGRNIGAALAIVSVPVPDWSGNITASHIEGEVLQYLRNGTFQMAGAALGPVISLAGVLLANGPLAALGAGLVGLGSAFGLLIPLLDSGVSNPAIDALHEGRLSMVELHSQALQTLLLYADAEENLGGWKADSEMAAALVAALFENEVGKAAGLAKGTTGAAEAGDQLQRMIAYSVIDEGVRPFGDLAARVFFEDGADLSVAATGGHSLFDETADALAQIVAQYAGQLAKAKVMTEEASDSQKDGVVGFEDGRLVIDLSQETWTVGSDGDVDIFGRKTLVEDLLKQDGLSESEALVMLDWLWNGDTHLIDRIEVETGSSGVARTLEPRPEEEGDEASVTLQIFSDGNDRITASDDREFMVGMEGNDRLDGGGGDDLIVGGAGNDILIGGEGRDLLLGGEGRDRAEYDSADGGAYGLTFADDPLPGMALARAGEGGADFLISIEEVVFSDDVDVLKVTNLVRQDDRVVFDAKATPDTDDILDLSDLSQGVEFKFGRVDDSNIEFRNFDVLNFGVGRDEVSHSVVNATINLGGGEDTLKYAAGGTRVYGGAGADIFYLADNIQIEDASSEDRIFFGGQALTGGFRNSASSNPYAFGLNPLIGYGINQEGALVIRDFIGGVLSGGPVEMFISNYNSSLTGGADTAGIHLFELTIDAYRLMDPNRPERTSDDEVFKIFLGHMLKALTGVSMNEGVDPLVLDLDGDGIELSPPGASMFDYDADGYLERGGWVHGDDGLLVLDANGDGQVNDVGELFGGPAMAGFAELATHDLNLDGVINALDSVYSELLVWRDLDQDRIVDAGEMVSLAAAGIAAVNLTATASSEMQVGNLIAATGSYTRADGSSGLVGDIVFGVDQQKSLWSGDRTVSAAAAALPTLKGYGTLVDLGVAMTLQPSLQATMALVLAGMTSLNLFDLRAVVLPLLMDWAEASPLTAPTPQGGHDDLIVRNRLIDGVWTAVDYAYSEYDPSSETTVWRWASTGVKIADLAAILKDQPPAGATEYASSLDGRFVDFFERYLGLSLDLGRTPADGGAVAEAMPDFLAALWRTVDQMSVRLLMQGPLASFFDGLEYNIADNTIVATTDRHLIPLFEAVFAEALPLGEAGQAYIDSWAGILDFVIGDYVQPDGLHNTHGFVFANVVAAYESVGLQLDIREIASALRIPADLVQMGDGRIVGSDDADIFYLHSGDQVAVGGLGPDTYVVGKNFGHDVIDDFEGALEEHSEDVVRFADIASTEVTARREGIDLIISVNGTEDELRIKDHFDGRLPGVGGGGDYSPSTGVDVIAFADGVIWGAVEIAHAVSRHSASADTLTGTDAMDWLDGGAGDDFLSGGSEADVYIYGRGYGNDVVSDLNQHVYLGGPDFLVFTDDITFDDLVFTREGDSLDLIISVKGEEGSLTIVDQFYSAYTLVLGTFWIHQIEGFRFEDGSSVDWLEVTHSLLLQAKTEGDDVIYGFNLEDVIDGGAGDDFLSGGNENDTYVFARGYGHDTIHERWDNIISGGEDRVVFAADIAPDDLTFTRDGMDLIITVRDSGDTLRVKDQYVVTETGPFGAKAFDQVETFKFGDGTVLEWPDVRLAILEASQTSGNDLVQGTHFADVIRGGAGDDRLEGGHDGDSYHFGLGDGNDHLADDQGVILGDADDRIVFGEGLTLEDIDLERDGLDLIMTIAPTGDSIRIDRQLHYSTINVRPWEIERFEFAGGEWYSPMDLAKVMITRAQTSGDDVVEGFQYDDLIEGGGGNDLLRGGDGSDIYRFELGFGGDVIEEAVRLVNYDDFDVVDFGNGLLSTNAVIGRDEDDLVLSFPTGETLRVAGQFGHSAYFDGWNDVEELRFADGIVWNQADLRLKLIAQASTDGDDIIEGFWGGDVFEGGAGDDVIHGLGGGDVYLVGAGSGHDTIHESVDTVYEDLSDVVRFDASVARSDVTVTRDGADLVLTYGAGADSVRVVNHFVSHGYQGIERVEFADGQALTKGEILVLVTAAQSTDGDDTIIGTQADDFIAGGLGNDTLKGGDGSDTYHFASGFGIDVIEESVGNVSFDDFDVIDFATGLHSSQATINRDGLDFVIAFASGDSVRVKNQFSHSAYFDGWNDIEEVRFGDGVVWSDADIREMLIAQASTAEDDLISGYWTDDVFDGGAGNDTIRGFGGADRYHFGFGSGHDVVIESVSTVYEDKPDAIVFGPGITSSDVTFSRIGNDLRVTLTGGADTLTVKDAFQISYSEVETFVFSDGVVLDLSAAMAALMAAATTDGDDRIIGSRLGDSLRGGTGKDILEGKQGADRYHFSVGDGQDIVIDQSDDDRIVFGRGVGIDDVRLKRTGNDLLIEIADGRSDAIVVKDHFLQSSMKIDGIEFISGVVWDATEIAARIEAAPTGTVLGTFLSEELSGSSGADQITGGQGDDRLSGGAGSDAYVYQRGDGSDIIADTGGAMDLDRLDLRGFGVAEAIFDRVGSDLRVTLGEETILVQGQFAQAGAGLGVEEILFTNGIVLSREDISTRSILRGTDGADTLNSIGAGGLVSGGLGNDILIGASGNETYLYASGDGNDEIRETSSAGVDRLSLLDLNLDQMRLSRSGYDLFIKDLTTGQTIKAPNHFLSGISQGYGLENIAFADGTLWDRSAIAANLWRYGTDGADTLGGSDLAEYYFGGLGDDTLRGDRGGDHYIYRSGDGNDLISDDSSDGQDLLDLTDLTAAQVALSRVSNWHLVITDLTTGQAVRVENQFLSSSYGIDSIRFAGGETWSRERLMAEAAPVVGTSGNDSLAGGAGTQVLIGRAGDDALAGGLGDDRYVWNPGDGNDVITDTGGADTLVLKGVQPSGVILLHLPNGDLGVRIVASGVEILISGHFATDAVRAVEAIAFDDGTIWSAGDIAQTAIEAGGDGDDYLAGTSAADTLLGGAGDDILFGAEGDDLLDGGEGDDQANFFGALDGVRFERLENGDILATDALGTNGVDTLRNIEAVYFDGDQNWRVLGDLVGDHGTSGHDAWISGTSYDDHLFGLAGDDTIAGQAGDDVIDGGDGYDQANYFGAFSDFEISRRADGAVVVEDKVGDQGVDVLHNIEAFYFDSYWTSAEVAVAGYGTVGDDDWVQGTAGQDNVYGLAGDDTLIGRGGNDRLYGGDGYDQANYLGASTDFVFVQNADGTITVTDTTGVEGEDILDGMEAVYFAADQVWSSIDGLLSAATSATVSSAVAAPGASHQVYSIEAVGENEMTEAFVVTGFSASTPTIDRSILIAGVHNNRGLVWFGDGFGEWGDRTIPLIEAGIPTGWDEPLHLTPLHDHALL